MTSEKRESENDREQKKKKNAEKKRTSLSERCLASSSVEGTPSAVVASDDSHMNVSTPRHPRKKPRRPRAKTAGADSVVVAADVPAAAELFLRPFFDALPSPPAAAAASVDEDGPAGEKSPLWAADRRMGERGEEGIWERRRD